MKSGTAAIDVGRNFQVFRMSLNADQPHDVFDQVAQIDAGDVEFELARLDLREIQDIVQDRQQRLGALADSLRIVALLLIQACHRA